MSTEPSLPRLSPEAAAELARAHWGIVGTAVPLPSYADLNFHVKPALPGEAGYVLKIANAAEPRAELEMQNAAMRWIAERQPGVCPEVQASTDGGDIVTLVVDGAGAYSARLVRFLPGALYSSLRPRGSRRRALLRSLGRFTGRLDRTLEGFEHPAADRKLRWDLKQAGWVALYVQEIAHRERRRLVAERVARLHDELGPHLAALPHQVIHNDANDNNVIIDPGASGERMPSVTGIIDFGDMVYTPTVCELAIAVAYAILGQRDVLDAATHVIAGYHAERPLSDAEQDVLMELVALRLSVSVMSSTLAARDDPDNAYIQVSERPAWRALEQLACVSPQLARDTVAEACSGREGTPDPARPRAPNRAARARLLDERRARVGPNLSLSYSEPLEIVRGSGQFLMDSEGRAFLDCVNNVCHVGHGHPRVVAALSDQAAVLNTNTRYLHPNLVRYARRLTALLPEPLSVCYFVCSGSEANDLALRMAQAHTRGDGVVVVDGAYHGNLSSLIDVSPYKCEGPGGVGLGGHVRKIPMPDTYRGVHRTFTEEVGQRYAAPVAAAFAEVAEAGHPPAAFLCESILSCGGQIVLPPGFLRAAYRHAHNVGAVCIADEVQVGFGRVGSHFWAFETQDVVPDIVTMGKPMGNGHPLAAVVTTPEIAASFSNGMEYFNTFGGNPVSCAAGLAVLDAIADEDLQANAYQVGARLLEGLRGLMGRHPVIGDVRGLGLFVGIELVEDRETREPEASIARWVVERMRERGILLSTDGPDHNVIKIKPALVFTEEDAARVTSNLDEVFAGLRAG